MKTKVSIPDAVFEQADRLAAELQISRSRLYSQALSEFVARHSSDSITETMNRVVSEIGAPADSLGSDAHISLL